MFFFHKHMSLALSELCVRLAIGVVYLVRIRQMTVIVRTYRMPTCHTCILWNYFAWMLSAENAYIHVKSEILSLLFQRLGRLNSVSLNKIAIHILPKIPIFLLHWIGSRIFNGIRSRSILFNGIRSQSTYSSHIRLKVRALIVQSKLIFSGW